MSKEEQHMKEQEMKPEKPAKDHVIKIKQSEHQKLINEAAEYKDKHLRLFAEFQNAQKRMDREKQEFIKYANEQVIVEFLEILDNLERTLNAAKTEKEGDGSLLKGIEMVITNINKLLAKHGVKPMETSGKKFDPHYHEVLMQEETDDHEEGMIIEELQKGYLLDEKVVRTAKVKIAAKKQSQENQDKENINS